MAKAVTLARLEEVILQGEPNPKVVEVLGYLADFMSGTELEEFLEHVEEEVR